MSDRREVEIIFMVFGEPNPMTDEAGETLVGRGKYIFEDTTTVEMIGEGIREKLKELEDVL